MSALRNNGPWESHLPPSCTQALSHALSICASHCLDPCLCPLVREGKQRVRAHLGARGVLPRWPDLGGHLTQTLSTSIVRHWWEWGRESMGHSLPNPDQQNRSKLSCVGPHLMPGASCTGVQLPVGGQRTHRSSENPRAVTQRDKHFNQLRSLPPTIFFLFLPPLFPLYP